jgi:hypothetical protein
MKPKMGRPLLSETAKDTLVGARLGSDEAKRFGDVAKQGGQSKSELVRDAINLETKRPPLWGKPKWNQADLDGQFIEFDLTSPQRKITGMGKLGVRKNPLGDIAVDIFVDEMQADGKMVCTRIWLITEFVDKISLNTKSKKAKFKIVA